MDQTNRVSSTSQSDTSKVSHLIAQAATIEEEGIANAVTLLEEAILTAVEIQEPQYEALARAALAKTFSKRGRISACETGNAYICIDKKFIGGRLQSTCQEQDNDA